MDTFGSILVNENPSSREPELQRLKAELGVLEERLFAGVANGLLAVPALEYEESAESPEIDCVSEKLHQEVARLRADLDSYQSAGPNPSSYSMWSSLSSAIFRSADKWKALSLEISRVSILLQETIHRRASYSDIYQLVYQHRLAEQSYTFFCHDDDFSSLARKYAELRERHSLLHRMGVELVQINETVFNLSSSNPSVLCQKITDTLLASFQFALGVNADYPDAGPLFTRGISSGLNVVGTFNRFLLYYMTREYAIGVGRKGNLFRREPDYEDIMGDSIYWRDKIQSNERVLRRQKQFYGALRMSAFPENRTTTITRELTAQLLAREEVAKWNKKGTAKHFRNYFSSPKAKEPNAPTLTLIIDSRGFTYHVLAQKFLHILNTRILFSGSGDAEEASIVYNGGLSQVYKVSLLEPLEFQSGSTPWRTSKVAVKVYSKSREADACGMLLREARVWSKLTHENIIPLFGIWENFDVCGMHNGALGLVSPWLDKGTLQSYLHNKPSTPEAERMRLLADITNALCFREPVIYSSLSDRLKLHEVHGQIFRIAHGDLKANNVILRDDRALLCDFGMSKIYDGVTGLSTSHSRNWRWQAPELLFRPAIDAEPTPESDIYSFGMLCLEVLSGRVPWEELGHLIGLQMRMKSRYMIPRRPRTKVKDTTLWDLMRRCWKDTPTLRPTAQEAAKELRRLVLIYSEEDALA